MVQRFIAPLGLLARHDGAFVLYVDHVMRVESLREQLAAVVEDLEAAKAELRRIHQEQLEASGWTP